MTVQVQVLSPAPRRSKVRFAPTSFFAFGTKRRRARRSLAPPPRKKSRLLRLLPCKRGRHASAALPTFCGHGQGLFHWWASFAVPSPVSPAGGRVLWCPPPTPSHALTLQKRTAYRHGRGTVLYSLIPKGETTVSPFGIKLYNSLPLPYHKGTNYILTGLTGGGRGWAALVQSNAAGETRGYGADNFPHAGTDRFSWPAVANRPADCFFRWDPVQ